MTTPTIWMKDGGLVAADGRPLNCPDCPCGPVFPGAKCNTCTEATSPITIYATVPPNFAISSINDEYAGTFALTGGFSCFWYYLYDGSLSGRYWVLTASVISGIARWTLTLGFGSLSPCAFNWLTFEQIVGPAPIPCFDFDANPVAMPLLSVGAFFGPCVGSPNPVSYSAGNATLSL